MTASDGVKNFIHYITQNPLEGTLLIGGFLLVSVALDSKTRDFVIWQAKKAVPFLVDLTKYLLPIVATIINIAWILIFLQLKQYEMFPAMSEGFKPIYIDYTNFIFVVANIILMSIATAINLKNN